jgi:hypothetical protein
MQAQPEKDKRKVHRSPSYPVFDLKTAIEKTKTIYDSEKRSATTPEVIASHMGYSQANGPGGRAVSALRQFGLIEETNGKYRISDTGYTLVHYDKESTEWKAAVSRAAKHPALFKELLGGYPEGLPSDATLKNELLRREFNPAVVNDVISIFRGSLSLADGADVAYNEEMEQDQVSEHKVYTPSRGAVANIAPASGSRKANQLATQVLAISIPRNLSVDIAVKGDELKREDLAKIKSQFNRWIEGLEEAFEE